MASTTRQRRRVAASSIAGAVAAVALVGVIGLNVASANSGSTQADRFGIEMAALSSASPAPLGDFAAEAADASYGASTLSQSSPRNIDAGVFAIEEEENAAAEAERQAKAAEDAAGLNRARSAMASQGSTGASIGLSEVDWTVGHDAFVEEWAKRIDVFLAGSPLAGQGDNFAQAAWDNGVDPRWSPAISKTESSRGAICFLPHNAWGWGASSWISFDESVSAHVAGLAKGYGYTLSKGAAAKYCPPNTDHWYASTLASMKSI